MTQRRDLNQSAAPASPRSTMRRTFTAFFDHNGRHLVQEAKELAGGLTNKSFFTRTLSSEYLARIPGTGTDSYINRQDESYNTKAAYDIGVTPEVIYDEQNGYKITRFLKEAVAMNSTLLKQPDLISSVAGVLHSLHTSSNRFANDIDVFIRNDTMRSMLATLPPLYDELDAKIQVIKHQLSQFRINQTACHNDTTPGNFLLSNGKMLLIDFEYSGNNDPAWDLACLSMEAEFEEWQDDILLKSYPTEDATFHERFTLYKPVVEYWVGLWCLVQLNNSNIISDSAELRQLEEKRMSKCKLLLEAIESKSSRMGLFN